MMVVVMALGFNFAVVPWPACAIIGVVMTLALFLSFDTLTEWIVIVGIAGLLAGLLTPPITTNCGRGRIAGPPAPPSTAGISVGAPTCEDPVNTEAPEKNCTD